MKEVELARERGIGFLSPPVSYPLFDTSYHRYATDAHFWIRWRFNAISKVLPKGDISGEVLEVGCGRGATAKLIENYYGCTVSGCDLDISALCMDWPQSRRYFYDICHRYEAWHGLFSVIFLLDVLEHIEDPVKFLQAVKFHLKKSGLLVINVPALPFLYSRYDKAQGHFKRYTLSVISKELGCAGFKVKKAVYWGMSMVPIILIRKFILSFCFKDNPVGAGFQPGSKLVSALLNGLMWIESRFFLRPLFGSSLLLVAEKAGEEGI